MFWPPVKSEEQLQCQRGPQVATAAEGEPTAKHKEVSVIGYNTAWGEMATPPLLEDCWEKQRLVEDVVPRETGPSFLELCGTTRPGRWVLERRGRENL